MAVFFDRMSNMWWDIYTGSTKTKYRSGASNYKSTQSKFINKEAVPKQALKKPFSWNNYYLVFMN